ncbi:MAG TPA: helix-turn-helix domain-containing protein [Candidatus Dormibacteraeota bacterium]|jgi:DNA-binding HxlR family transcriptional regulator|nr:helix-turn-helix domain-containing protein [Candidatus Dormibacteraeota bacterium]
MRSYKQYCALAKALDAIGDRWSLLIVRELMLLGPCRYTDLLHGLPGIATNLLAARLRELEEAGVVWREAAPPPVATTLFHLTERGEALRPVVRELGHWGAPLLAQATEDDVFHTYWMTLPLDLYYIDTNPRGAPITIEVRTGDEPMVIETVDGKVTARRGTVSDPDAVLVGPPRLVIGVLSGRIELAEARAQGLQLRGDAGALRRVRSAHRDD